jgi:hypothetical protein
MSITKVIHPAILPKDNALSSSMTAPQLIDVNFALIASSMIASPGKHPRISSWEYF